MPPQQITEVIATVVKDQTHANRVVTTVHQFSLHSSIHVTYM